MIGVPSVLVYMLCAQELRCEGVGVCKGRQWMGMGVSACRVFWREISSSAKAGKADATTQRHTRGRQGVGTARRARLGASLPRHVSLHVPGRGLRVVLK